MTGTNKLGLLLVLLDFAPERTEGDQSISRKDLATRYLDIHWEHGRPYGELVLRQSSVNKRRNSGKPANDTTVMQQIYRLRKFLDERGYGELRDRSFDIVQHGIKNTDKEEEWNIALGRALVNIERDLWRNPIEKLQNLPGQPGPFLFSTRHDEIQLLQSVAEELTRFSGVLRPLIEFRFAELVAKINRENLDTDEYHIHEHLFDRERSMPPKEIRRGLIELQGNKCIFTGRSLNLRSGSLDHVIPWSRTRLSLIENFVVTTKSANSSKSDSLLGPDLVERWLIHIGDNSHRIEQLARENGWPTDSRRVRSVALHIYEALHPATGVWHGKDEGVKPLGDYGRSRIIEELRI